MTRILVIILSVIALAACSRTLDARLVRVNRLANENLADSAMQALDSIDRASLDEYNRHYYDLMTVKTRDKADFQFYSDSLVLSAMEYFKKNGTDTVRAEAFYYAGRVARMLGDSPQALDYMQNALNCLDDSHTRLKGKISSQMGQIFLNLYLFEQAKTRFKDAVIYNRDSRDSLALFFNYTNLGENSYWLQEYDSSLVYYKLALDLTDFNSKCKGKRLHILMHLANYYIDTNDTINAVSAYNELERIATKQKKLNLIKRLGLRIGAFLNDSEICGSIAVNLVNSQSVYDKKDAYGVLFQLALKNNQPDKIHEYAEKYIEAIETINNNSSKNAVIHQNSLYNYSLREKENAKLKKSQSALTIGILITVVVCVLLLLILSTIHMRAKKVKMELVLQKSRIEQLKQKIENVTNGNIYENPLDKTSDSLKEILKNEFDNIISGVDESTRIPVERILTSDVFMRIKNALYTENCNLNESDWSELSDIVNEEYHNFRNKLYLLNNKISAHEYRVCLLIKCGFSPNETSKLLNRSKEAISSTRRRLCYKCFLVKSSPENFDKFIYSL